MASCSTLPAWAHTAEGGCGTSGQLPGRARAGAGNDPRVVPRRDGVDAEQGGPLQQAVELEVAVALDARVGCAPGSILGEEVREDALAILGAEIDLGQRHLQLFADPTVLGYELSP